MSKNVCTVFLYYSTWQGGIKMSKNTDGFSDIDYAKMLINIIEQHAIIKKNHIKAQLDKCSKCEHNFDCDLQNDFNLILRGLQG
jgi:hypothetical protein